MRKEKFPQDVFCLANSIIALKRQGESDPRLEKRKIQLAERLEKHPDETRTRITEYISSKSRVTAGGDHNRR
jgi:hypothetical protein